MVCRLFPSSRCAVAVLFLSCPTILPAQSAADLLVEQRLQTMKAAAAAYAFRGSDGGSFAVSPEPLLRFTNPVSGLQAGGFFVWSDARGRPQAAAQLFLTADNLWLHEFQSLATGPFTASLDGRLTWEPRNPGVQRRPLPDTPSPAETAVKRLVQMRDVAKRFAATDEFEGRPKSDELRLLPKPLVRFGTEGAETLDGALFTLAHGTDPELLILIEAVRTDREYRWFYALAPMTGYVLAATLDSEPVWSVDWRKGPYSPKDSFFLRVAGKEPKSSEKTTVSP
jgi:hypothetical protein